MRHWLPAMVMGIPLAACQSMPNGLQELEAALNPNGPVSTFVAERRAAARRHEAASAWRDALREWQLIKAVKPRDTEVDRQIDRTRQELERQFVHQHDMARAAEKAGRFETQRSALLQALALQPGDRATARALQATEARLAYAAMAAQPGVARGAQSELEAYTAQRSRKRTSKPAAETGGGTGGVTRRRDPAPASPRQQAARLMSLGRYEAALKTLEQLKSKRASGGDGGLDAEIARARRALAERHYERGVAAFRGARYDEAVNEFELALRYEPDHHKARFYHSSADALSKQ